VDQLLPHVTREYDIPVELFNLVRYFASPKDVKAVFQYPRGLSQTDILCHNNLNKEYKIFKRKKSNGEETWKDQNQMKKDLAGLPERFVRLRFKGTKAAIDVVDYHMSSLLTSALSLKPASPIGTHIMDAGRLEQLQHKNVAVALLNGVAEDIKYFIDQEKHGKNKTEKGYTYVAVRVNNLTDKQVAGDDDRMKPKWTREAAENTTVTFVVLYQVKNGNVTVSNTIQLLRQEAMEMMAQFPSYQYHQFNIWHMQAAQVQQAQHFAAFNWNNWMTQY